MNNKAVVVYSGGMDSFTLLNEVVRDWGQANVFAITFDYGQRHEVEVDYATVFCLENQIDHEIVFMGSLGTQLMGGSSQTDNAIAVPEGHYEEESMKDTVVPNRNMIMLSLAMAHCIQKDAGTLFYGAHSGDHAIYPDCRPDFVSAMKAVARTANYLPIDIRAPYLALSKGDILARGMPLGLDYSKTWTCYAGKEKPCGKCGACQERLEAFKENGLTDPLEYADA